MSDDLLASSAETWRAGGDPPAVPEVLTRLYDMGGTPWGERLRALRERYVVRQQRAIDYFAGTRSPMRGLPVAPSSAAVGFVKGLVASRRGLFIGLVAGNVLAAGSVFAFAIMWPKHLVGHSAPSSKESQKSKGSTNG